MRSFLIFFISLILTATTACVGPKIKLFTDASDPLKESVLEGKGDEKILLIPIKGMISDSPNKNFMRSTPSVVQAVVSQLKKAEKDKQIKAVLLKINSPGGTITASDVLYHEIMAFKERTNAKTIVSMMDIATSGAYYISLPADMIMAHPTTVTGSVGVIFVRPKVGGLTDKIGVDVSVQKFGKNKDMGSPFKESSEEERALFQSLVDDMGNRFINLVQKHRKPDSQALSEISTARVFLAEEALRLGLVDKIGYLSDAVKEAEKLAGLSDDAKVVVYRRSEFPEDNFYNTAGAESAGMSPLINIELPEYMTPTAGFYYLWNATVRED